MLVFVMLVVAAGNAGLLRGDPAVAALVAVLGGAVLLGGGALGRLLGGALGRAAVFSLGVRDFAVAAALVLAAGLPAAAALPAAGAGALEMVAASGLAAWWSRRPG